MFFFQKSSIFVIVFFSLYGTSITSQMIGDTEPPGQLITVGGIELHLYCEGNGEPAIILNTGLGGFYAEWFQVLPEISKETRICAYDRAGYGWSKLDKKSKTLKQTTEELNSLLNKAKINPPYIMVGHSLGGFIVQYFSKLYPQKTAGIVLIDSSHAEQFMRLSDIPKRNNRRGHLVTFINPSKILNFYPIHLQDKIFQLITKKSAFYAQQYELNRFRMYGQELANNSSALPIVPLYVISRGEQVWGDTPRGETLEKSWQEMQKELANLLPNSTHFIAKESGHLIHMEKPSYVIEGITDVLKDVRAKMAKP